MAARSRVTGHLLVRLALELGRALGRGVRVRIPRARLRRQSVQLPRQDRVPLAHPAKAAAGGSLGVHLNEPIPGLAVSHRATTGAA
jgi:hypothetical protein